MTTYLAPLLATLRAAQQVHWTAHWQTRGPSSYGDHQLFERLYAGLTEEIDGLAEKIVAMDGPDAVDPLVQMQGMAEITARWVVEPDLVARGLMVERDIQSSIEVVLKALEGNPQSSVGLVNFIEGLADAHETHLYLLIQRSRTAANKTDVSRVAARFLIRGDL